MRRALTALVCACAAALAAGGLAAGAPGARAETVRTQWTAFMRAGPGQQFQVIDEVDSASLVDVRACNDAWCLVTVDRAAGYMPADVLRQSDLTPPPAQPGLQPSPCFTENLQGYRGHEGWRICGR